MKTEIWWLPLNRAAEVVRNQLKLGLAQPPDRSVEELDGEVANLLREVFASGTVRTLVSGIDPGFDGEFLLHAAVAAREFFAVNLPGNYLRLPDTGGKYEARLHSTDLRQFLEERLPIPAKAPSLVSEEADLEWLIQEVKVANRGSKGTLQRRAIQRGMSVRAFQRHWPKAIEIAGRLDLSRPGKPGLKS